MSNEQKTFIPEALKAGNFNGKGIFDFGEENVAYADYFTGTSYLALLNMPGLIVANVTFEPGCRNFWHIHHKGGQILLVTGGRGWLSGSGSTSTRTKPRRCRSHCAGHQTLAWRGQRQLVCPCGGRDSGRRFKQ